MKLQNKILVAVIVLSVIIFIDHINTKPILESVSTEILGAKQTLQEFTDTAKVINPNYPINIPWISLKKPEHLPTYLKYKEKLLTPVFNQLRCSSCWSYTVTAMLADRISIYTGGKVMRPLSVQEMLSCWDGHNGDGCKIGGIPETAYQYIIKNGISTAEDYPYNASLAKCEESRKDGFRTYFQRDSVRSLCRDPTPYKEGSSKHKQIIDANILNMKHELLYNGSFVGTIYVYQNLYDYDGLSIYTGHNNSKYIGGHALNIIGYSSGEMNGDEPGFDGDYWICRNSWSMDWPSKSPASKGFFYIRMGENVCGIESRASRALPVITQEIRQNMVKSLSESRYETYGEYVNDPERENYITSVGKMKGYFS